MNPGRLNRKIQIQRQAPGLYMVTATGEYMTTAAGDRMTTASRQDALGQEVDVWGLWKTRWARRLLAKGKESSGNVRERSEASVPFRLRWTDGLSSSDRLVDLTDGQAYDIEDWDGDRHEGWMDIYCTQRRTPENANQGIS